MREQKNWVDKSAKTRITIASLLKKLLPKMLLGFQKETFRTRKRSFSHDGDNNELLIIMIIITK